MNMPSRNRTFLILLGWVGLIASGWTSLISESIITVLTTAFLYGSLATAWNIHALSGVMSLGHAAFFGLGAYGFAITVSRSAFSPWTGILIGAFLAVFYALLWTVSIDRLRHGSFVLASFVSVEIPRVIIENLDSITNGSAGITNLKLLNFPYPLPSGSRGLYVIMIMLAGLLVFIHHKAIVSRLGWGLRAMRDDERAALAIGVPADFLRRSALIISAFFTGMCGAFYAAIIGFVEPSVVFSLHYSAIPLVFAFFGGREKTWGPLVGAILLYGLDQVVMVPAFPEAHRAIYGIAIFFTLWFLPRGILSAWRRRS